MPSPHEFTAEIAAYDFGKYAYHVVWLPAEHPRLRVEAEIDGRPHAGAFCPARGGWYLLLSKKVLKALGRALGERVHVRFRVADQDAVDVPIELAFALEANGRARTAWDAATPGKQRGWAYRVGSAKRAETRERRVEGVIDELLRG